MKDAMAAFWLRSDSVTSINYDLQVDGICILPALETQAGREGISEVSSDTSAQVIRKQDQLYGIYLQNTSMFSIKRFSQCTDSQSSLKIRLDGRYENHTWTSAPSNSQFCQSFLLDLTSLLSVTS